MQADHTSKTGEHYTPREVLDLFRAVCGPVDFDPASCAKANETVGAQRYLKAADDGLDPKTPWGLRNQGDVTTWVNPPGGKVGNQSKAALFLRRALDERIAGTIGALGFQVFNLSLLQVLQQNRCYLGPKTAILLYSQRLRYPDAQGIPQGSPPHPSATIFLPAYGEPSLAPKVATALKDSPLSGLLLKPLP